jgi:hypothetical protein
MRGGEAWGFKRVLWAHAEFHVVEVDLDGCLSCRSPPTTDISPLRGGSHGKAGWGSVVIRGRLPA